MKTKITVNDRASYKPAHWDDVFNGNFVLVEDPDKTTHLCVYNYWEGNINLISIDNPEDVFWLNRRVDKGLPKLLAIVKEVDIKFKV